MKRFRFSLERVEDWRRQNVVLRRREHESATAVLRAAEEALLDHDGFTREYLEELTRRRRAGADAVEMLVESERMRESLAARRAGLEAGYRDARWVAEQSLERLIAARKDLKALESLRAARHAEWRREMESESQKQADEVHRSRLLLERRERAQEEAGEVEECASSTGRAKVDAFDGTRVRIPASGDQGQDPDGALDRKGRER